MTAHRFEHSRDVDDRAEVDHVSQAGLHVRTVVLACAVGLATAFVTTPAHAATTFTQLSLTATVTGSSVKAATRIRASTTTVVQQYGICARDSAGNNADFPRKTMNPTISTWGTGYSATQTLSPGAYTYYPCVLSAGTWSSVGTKTFTVTSTPTGTSEVLFSDDFTGPAGTKPDVSKWGEWSGCSYNSTAYYGNIDCGTDETLDGVGHLVIPADPGHGSSLTTKDHFAFTYGTITARMLVPTEVGYWPAFWTLNSNPNGSNDRPIAGEIDVIEAYTTFGDGYRRATHHYTPQGTWSSADDPLCAEVDVRGSWHDYSAKVEPGQVTFYFDGVQCGPAERSNDPEAGGKPYAFGPNNTAGNWLLLTLAVGGAGGQQKPAAAPSKLLVDRVEVRAL